MGTIESRLNGVSLPSAAGRRLVGAWFGLAVLLVNLISGLGLPAVPQSVPGLDGLTVICSAGGMVVVDRDRKPVPPEPRQSGPEFCAFCLPTMQAAMGAASPAVPAAPVLVAVFHAWPQDYPPPPRLHALGGLAARAPPVV